MRFLTSKEVCQILMVSQSRLHQLTSWSKIAHSRVGGHILFEMQDVLNYIQKHPGSRAFRNQRGRRRKAHLRLLRSKDKEARRK